MPNVFCQPWEESEAGWGTRPDGFSLHYTIADRQKYVEEHAACLRQAYGNQVPQEYDRPDGDPYIIEVDDATYSAIGEVKERHGMRFLGRAPFRGEMYVAPKRRQPPKPAPTVWERLAEED